LQVDRLLRNKYDETAANVVCARVPGAAHGVRDKITLLLEGEYFVRLLRSEDNDARIAAPWSPSEEATDQDQEYVQTPTPRRGIGVRFSEIPRREPPISVKACAGPMSRGHAELFRRRWAAPPMATERESFIKYKQVGGRIS